MYETKTIDQKYLETLDDYQLLQIIKNKDLYTPSAYKIYIKEYQKRKHQNPDIDITAVYEDLKWKDEKKKERKLEFKTQMLELIGFIPLAIFMQNRYENYSNSDVMTAIFYIVNISIIGYFICKYLLKKYLFRKSI